MTRIICIAGGKGGISKTLTTINLGAALNQFGKNVAIIDTNLTTPNIGLYLGVPVVPISLHDVLKDKNHITEAIYQHKSGLKIIPGSISLSNINPNTNKLKKAIHSLHGLIDIALLDTPAGLGKETISVLEVSDEVLIVTNPEIPAITDALKTIKLAKKLHKPVIGVIVARTKNDNLEIPLENISNLLERPIIGTIPEDPKIRNSLNEKDAIVYLYPKSTSSIAYKKIAASLVGYNYKEENKNFFDLLLEKLGFS